jgi:hypothetical protein
MTERVLGPTGSRRRRRFLLAPLCLVVLLGLLVVGGAQAVHDEDFQLDGDVNAATPTNIGGSSQDIDWSSLFNADGSNKTLPTGFEAARLDKDFSNSGSTFITSDGSTFATGSKDTLPISGWQCNFDNNVNSKIDVANAYAAIYTASSGDEILYFGLERNANTGTANVGFWFLQDEVACESAAGAVSFSGAHTDGDLLVVSEFTGGGTVSTINVYRWNGGAAGSLGTTPVANATNADCRGLTVPVDDLACGAANTVAITTPWLTAAKTTGVGNNVPIAQFYEAGLNLSDANLGGKCFSTFIGDTRSSTSLTATLFDFSLGVLGSCQSGVVTTPQTGAGGSIGDNTTTKIGTAARVAVRDQAVITVDGSDDPFGGTVKFFLCGPLALNSTSNCQTGGVQIGAAAGETVSGDNGTATVNSAIATLTSVGDYCWRAEYSGDADAGIPASSDPTDATNRSECFQINPETPTLTTEAGPDVIVGNPITDNATLTGTAMQPGTDGLGPGGTINATAGSQAPAGGSISWTVQGPGGCAASGLTVSGSPKTVAGDGTYGPVSATPTLLGTYTFVATYTGSSPNTLGAAGSCPDAAEEATVIGNAALTTEQDWLPNDTATLTGPTNLTGTLTFKLYTGDNCGATSGAPVANQEYIVPVNNAASGSTFSTSNTTFKVKASASYSWLVTYVDNVLGDPAPHCEKSTLSITN